MVATTDELLATANSQLDTERAAREAAEAKLCEREQWWNQTIQHCLSKMHEAVSYVAQFAKTSYQSQSEPPALLKEIERLRAECAKMTRIVAPDEAFQNRAELINLRSRLQVAKTALTGIIAECPNPKLPYGVAVVEIAREALSQLNDLEAEKPRTVQCTFCGSIVSDWVDPDWSKGRICHECEARHEPKDTQVPLAKEQLIPCTVEAENNTLVSVSEYMLAICAKGEELISVLSKEQRQIIGRALLSPEAPTDDTGKVLLTKEQHEELIDTLDRHHRLAAEVRCLLHNNGFGPNLSQLKRADTILREIAGLPLSADAKGLKP